MKKVSLILISLTLFLIPLKSYAVTYATWNPSDKSTSAVLTNGNLTNTGSTPGIWAGVRSTIGKSSGKWYWEVTIGAPSDGYIFTGIANSSWLLDATIFADANGWGYTGVSGAKANGAGEVAYGSTYTNGDIIGVALDMDGKTITFYKNGVSQGQAFSGLSGTLYAITGPLTGSNAGTANFGATNFAYTPPAGYCYGLSDTCASPSVTLKVTQDIIWFQ